MESQEYQIFFQKIKALTGIDLNAYKSSQMERRLRTLMSRSEAGGFLAYARLLERDPQRLQEFKDFITINVTEFFRNPEKYRELKELVLPALLRSSPSLRVWSAGCSMGAEPYSLAIILDELTPGQRHHILATDVDATILSRAREGIYTERDIQNVDKSRRLKYFRKVNGGFQIIPEIRERVRFQQHDLLLDPFGNNFDLILCRNVVIYFTEKAKDELYHKFHRALKPGGVLFVGGTECIIKPRELGFEPFSPFFYRKTVSSQNREEVTHESGVH